MAYKVRSRDIVEHHFRGRTILSGTGNDELLLFALIEQYYPEVFAFIPGQVSNY